MLLRNFYNALGSWMEGAAPESLVTTAGSSHSYTQTNANKLSTTTSHICVGASTITNFHFGDGGVEPTFDDYKLSGTRITTLSGLVNRKRTQDETGITIEYNFTLTNTGTSSITIRELAYMGDYGAGGYWVMIWRDVLDNPLTLEPNGVGQITHTVKLNYPTF